MPDAPIPPHDSLIPLQPGSCRSRGLLHAGAWAAGRPAQGRGHRRQGSGRAGRLFDRIAAKLYRMASMLVGEGEESVRLVETAVANAEVSVCQDPTWRARAAGGRWRAAALELLASATPAAWPRPRGWSRPQPASTTTTWPRPASRPKSWKSMIAGPERDRVREWLDSLPTWMRAVFVLRAVAGFTAAETATLLRRMAGRKPPLGPRKRCARSSARASARWPRNCSTPPRRGSGTGCQGLGSVDQKRHEPQEDNQLLQRRQRLRLGGKESGVLGDAHHGEDLGEVRRKPEGVDLLAGVRGLDQHLNHQRDAARVDVIHLGESPAAPALRSPWAAPGRCPEPRPSRCWRCRPRSAGR